MEKYFLQWVLLFLYAEHEYPENPHVIYEDVHGDEHIRCLNTIGTKTKL